MANWDRIVDVSSSYFQFQLPPMLTPWFFRLALSLCSAIIFTLNLYLLSTYYMSRLCEAFSHIVSHLTVTTALYVLTGRYHKISDTKASWLKIFYIYYSCYLPSLRKTQEQIAYKGSTPVLTELPDGYSLCLASRYPYIFSLIWFVVHLTVHEVNFICYKAQVTIPFVMQQYKHLKCSNRIKTKKEDKHKYYYMAHHTATSNCMSPVKMSLHGCGIFSF